MSFVSFHAASVLHRLLLHALDLGIEQRRAAPRNWRPRSARPSTCSFTATVRFVNSFSMFSRHFLLEARDVAVESPGLGEFRVHGCELRLGDLVHVMVKSAVLPLSASA